MSEKKILFLFCLLLLILAKTVLGEEKPSPADANTDLARLQQTYGNLTSLRFDFSQVTRTQLRARTGNGTAIFLRTGDKNNKSAGIMRWNYNAPEKQIILNTGRELSIYNEKDRQLLVMPASEVNDDLTYSLFSGTRKLEDLFQVQPPDPRFVFNQPGTNLKSLRLVPRKPHPQVQAIQIWFDDRYLIHHMIIEDHFDTITEMNFTNIRINTIDPRDTKQIRAITSLDLPEDVEVIRQ